VTAQKLGSISTSGDGATYQVKNDQDALASYFKQSAHRPVCYSQHINHSNAICDTIKVQSYSGPSKSKLKAKWKYAMQVDIPLSAV